MQLAKELDVAFVQVLEPRAKGKYEGLSVELKPEKIKLLEDIFLKYNNEKKYIDFPIINYLGYHQRKLGCFGAGNRFLYIDTDGDAHICPFCDNKVINANKATVLEIINELSKNKCMAFQKNSIL